MDTAAIFVFECVCFHCFQGSFFLQYSYYRSRGHPVAIVCFNSKSLGGEVKIGFQDGSYGSHSGFQIGMILAIFHLHINLLLHCKF